MTPTIVVVDGYSTGSVLARRLAERGARLVHVRSAEHPAGFFLRGFRPQDYAEDFGHIADPEVLAQKASGAGVTEVVAGTESGVVLADRLAHRLGLPGNVPGLVAARRDKRLMARVAGGAGLAVPAGAAFTTTDAALAWYAAAPYPAVVVKPLDSAGTDNVWFCSGAAEVAYACDRVLRSDNLYGVRNRQVLVQERVTGTEVYANTVSRGGVHRVAEMWTYAKRLGPTGGPIYDHEDPVPPGSARDAEVRPFLFAVLDALGIRESAAHTEIMLTGRGPVLIESGARLGGGTMPDVVERFSGTSQTALFAEALLDPAGFRAHTGREARWSAAVRNVALVNTEPVTVGSCAGLRSLSGLPTFVAASPAPARGQVLPPTVDLLTSPGYIYLAAADPREVERDYRVIRTRERSGLYR